MHYRCCSTIYFKKIHTFYTIDVPCAPFHSRRSDQALPVIVLINKMDRKDAAPFPDLEVPAPHAACSAASRLPTENVQ
jgi:hypothetical protein